MSPEPIELLPPGFEDLEPWASDWALKTQAEREARRRTSTSAQMLEFYDAVFPRIRDILAEVDRFPIGGLPDPQQRLFALAFMLSEVAHNVERYAGDVRVTRDFDEARFIAAHADHPTWRGPDRR